MKRPQSQHSYNNLVILLIKVEKTARKKTCDTLNKTAGIRCCI